MFLLSQTSSTLSKFNTLEPRSRDGLVPSCRVNAIEGETVLSREPSGQFMSLRNNSNLVSILRRIAVANLDRIGQQPDDAKDY